MDQPVYDWDFFLAHASADKAPAESLYEVLSSRSKVFLDLRCIDLGANWDEVIASAQRKSLITLALISPNTEKAFYLRDEIASAIQMARENENHHKVVPIFLNGAPGKDVHMPYGLRLKQGISIQKHEALEDIALKLLSLLTKFKAHLPDAAKPDEIPVATPKMKESYNTGSIRKLITGALTDEELNSLCMDEFLSVFNQFTGGMNKAQKIQVLIEYCSRQRMFPKLLDLIKDINPVAFKSFQDSH